MPLHMNILDRYLSRHLSIGESVYQLVAMTSLYLAVKLHSTRKISVSSMSELSKGHFRVDQIEQMEVFIIKTLRWRLNPPTPTILLNIASPIIHALVKDDDSYEIGVLAKYLLELSVCDAFFIDKRPSSIAYASILVAMDYLSTCVNVKDKVASFLLDELNCGWVEDLDTNKTNRCVQQIHLTKYNH